jgi:hypothetical protein
LLIDVNCMLFMCADLCAPLALNAVKGQQVGCSCCTALEFIDVNYIQSVCMAGVIRRSVGCAHGGPQSKTPYAAHTVDTDSHKNYHLCALDQISLIIIL